jgi:hypothetical protein
VLEVESRLIEFNERLALSAVTIRANDQVISVYGTALAKESVRYTDLAQARALILARQILENGIQSVQSEHFVTDESPVVLPPAIEKRTTPLTELATAVTHNVIIPEPPPAAAPEADVSTPSSHPLTPTAAVEPVEADTEPLPAIDW